MSEKRYVVEDGFTVATICFPMHSGNVLLGLKSTRHAFGAAMWHGPGGKMEEGVDESIRACARRELEDEVGIRGQSFEEIGILFSDHPPMRMKVHIFIVRKFIGMPHPTEEMDRVEWFSPSDVPWGAIWPDMKEWFPDVIARRSFTAFAQYGEGGQLIACHVERGIHERFGHVFSPHLLERRVSA
jgi:8-oxo-dGTP pyrophosphatase MutT (NUDIX family)